MRTPLVDSNGNPLRKGSREYNHARYERNKERRKSYARAAYYRHKDRRIQQAAKWAAEHAGKSKEYKRDNQARYKAFVDWLKDQPCQDCGSRFPPECMDFDHVRGEKHETIGMGPRTWEFLAAEVQKCDLVCSNCHRTRTRKRMKAV